MERNRKKRNYKKERGITLVALIITIIVMLILVAVTVRVVVESDIIGVAEKAAESKETGELKDQVAMKIGEWQLGKYVEDTKNKTLTEYLSEIKGVQVAGTTVTKGDTVITVNENGEIMTSGEYDTWDGTREIPIIENGNWYIYSAEQFKFLADYVNDDPTLTNEEKNAVTAIEEATTVYLMADIDLGARPGEGATVEEQWETDANKAKRWTPIGTTKDTYMFEGEFEGNGHVISGVYVSTENYGGIFGNTTNKIQNLIVKDSYIKATGGAIGGIIGVARVIEGGETGKILNCHNVNTYVIGEHYIGGIAGQANAIVQGCTNSGSITGNDQGTGGIVGLLSTNAEINTCSNEGVVSGLGKSTGGICGQAKDNTKVIICKNTGDITGTANVGGIAGSAYGTIEKCYNEGDITAKNEYLGGIAGIILNAPAAVTIQNTYNTGTLIATNSFTGCLGGITGGMSPESASVVNIKNNYNVGPINIEGTNATDIGGAIGARASSDKVKADRNYYLAGVVTPNISHTKETSKTDEYMKTQAFVNDLNDLGEGLTQNVWVKTSEYPALIGM